VGIARLDQGAVKLPVVTLPEFLLCLIPSQHLLFNFMKLAMGGISSKSLAAFLKSFGRNSNAAFLIIHLGLNPKPKSVINQTTNIRSLDSVTTQSKFTKTIQSIAAKLRYFSTKLP
jgi:hypothetical protein